MGSTLNLKNLSFVIGELKVINNYSLKKYSQVQPINFSDKIIFDHVGFSYPQSEQDILKDITFELKKGETIGFIGASGSGKTTLLNVFLRFMIENRGSISIDGFKLNETNKHLFKKLLVTYSKMYILKMEHSEKISLLERDL
ncbi:MAG: ATP-binding cassette domain-containing protein [Saprospiraceae bacterium]|nr:ATP-binding cassette domain-containing protein [Saprospiraceae bacterium]